MVELHRNSSLNTKKTFFNAQMVSKPKSNRRPEKKGAEERTQDSGQHGTVVQPCELTRSQSWYIRKNLWGSEKQSSSHCLSLNFLSLPLCCVWKNRTGHSSICCSVWTEIGRAILTKSMTHIWNPTGLCTYQREVIVWTFVLVSLLTPTTQQDRATWNAKWKHAVSKNPFGQM